MQRERHIIKQKENKNYDIFVVVVEAYVQIDELFIVG
jgi:hypothetical protein